MRDVVTSLVSSVIAGSAVWLSQWLLRYRRVARKRSFFGVSPANSCLLVAPRHYSSDRPMSVHRRDMAALVELGTIVNDCGGRTDVVMQGTGVPGIGRVTEFCVGAPAANPRTEAHLRSVLSGVRFEPDDEKGGELKFTAGSTVYRREPGRAEHVVLAKAYVPDARHPVFVIAGQTAQTNLAAARLLASQYRKLIRTYGTHGRFCLVLTITEPDAYGPDFVEIAADVTDDAFR